MVQTLSSVLGNTLFHANVYGSASVSTTATRRPVGVATAADSRHTQWKCSSVIYGDITLPSNVIAESLSYTSPEERLQAFAVQQIQLKI